MRFVLFVFVTLFAALPHAQSAEPSSCKMSDVPKKVQDRGVAWLGESRRWGQADDVLKDVKTAIDAGEFSECEMAYIAQVRHRVMARTKDPETSIPALEAFVRDTTPETNSGWSNDVVRLSKQYKKVQAFSELAILGETYMDVIKPDHRHALESSFYIGLIGMGESERALDFLQTQFELDRSALTRHELRYALALSQRLGVSDLESRLETEMTNRTGRVSMPGPLPAFEGDMLDNLIARDTGTRYQVTITKPPIPMYPLAAARRSLNGTCDVKFDISKTGKPKKIKAECSNSVFERSARQAFKRARYEPLVIDGIAYDMTSITYPLEFNIN